MVASEAGSVALVQMLLSRGANANAVDDEGRTALDLARRAGHEECAKLLATKTSSAHGGEHLLFDCSTSPGLHST